MNREEAKLILSVYRAGTADAQDPFFAEALRLAEQDQELANWFAAEQKCDSIIAAKLDEESAVPFGLKTSLVAAQSSPARPQGNWLRAFGLMAGTAAVTFMTAMIFFKSAPHSENSLADYRREMVSFVKLTPSLEFKTGDAGKVQEWLQNSAQFGRVSFPKSAENLPSVGCRILNFHNQPVALICFLRQNGQLVHLLVVNRAAFSGKVLPTQTQFKAEGEWMTATWADDDKVYLLTTKGGENELRKFL